MKVAIIGVGHVGLVTATCLAEKGHRVVGIDNDRNKIKQLQSGKTTIYEPGLSALVRRNRRKGRLVFSDSIRDGVRFADIIFIAVGTPLGVHGGADLSQVRRVAREVARHLNGYSSAVSELQPTINGSNSPAQTAAYKVIAEKSTVPVGTALELKKTIRRYASNNAKFDIVSNPEFLQEGNAIKTTLYPDRIVVGVESKRAERLMRKLYANFRAPLIVTDLNSAELIKHAANSFLATKISYINAVANICEKTGADIKQVAYGMGLDKRIAPYFLQAGIGYGGFCFPKDVAAFCHIADKAGYDFQILKAAQKANYRQRELFVDKIRKALGRLHNKHIAVWGLSFKPDTDDIRESPAIEIVRRLVKAGAKVTAYDPRAMPDAKAVLPYNVHYARNHYDATRNADCLVIATDWDEFKHSDLKRLRRLMNKPMIVDGRNIFEPAK
ncbi:MAG: UDP-glucose/GDP-mannose dehydrogenase family protein, partial [Planctomycetes bacterium]|nr:UDP-glucose/GDP-mannose dehydrogenase family protein [Planctomycetota bacterium]